MRVELTFETYFHIFYYECADKDEVDFLGTEFVRHCNTLQHMAFSTMSVPMKAKWTFWGQSS